jgi:hypothetical protein
LDLSIRRQGDSLSSWTNKFLASKHAARGMSTQKQQVVGFITKGASPAAVHFVSNPRIRPAPDMFADNQREMLTRTRAGSGYYHAETGYYTSRATMLITSSCADSRSA